MGKLKEIDTYAAEMTEVFKQHSQTIGVATEDYFGPTQTYVNNAGLEKLSDIFGRVPIELRAPVYETFLDKLTEAGLSYDITNLQGHTIH